MDKATGKSKKIPFANKGRLLEEQIKKTIKEAEQLLMSMRKQCWECREEGQC